jgi:hypothetical protein
MRVATYNMNGVNGHTLSGHLLCSKRCSCRDPYVLSCDAPRHLTSYANGSRICPHGFRSSQRLMESLIQRSNVLDGGKRATIEGAER